MQIKMFYEEDETYLSIGTLDIKKRIPSNIVVNSNIIKELIINDKQRVSIFSKGSHCYINYLELKYADDGITPTYKILKRRVLVKDELGRVRDLKYILFDVFELPLKGDPQFIWIVDVDQLTDENGWFSF